MRLEQLHHVLAAAAEVTGEDEFVVIGSQAILGTYPDAPEPLLRSMEADVYPLGAPEKADLVDEALGDGSPFHRTFGYYAHGVGPETAKAPAGRHGRLVRVAVPARVTTQRQTVALYLEAHDLVLAKCAAGRDRDWEFARDALKAGLVRAPDLLGRVDAIPLDAPGRDHIRTMLESMAGAP